MTLLLLFRRGYGDWPERPVSPSVAPATPTNDRLLVAPLQRSTQQPVTVKRPTTKLR